MAHYKISNRVSHLLIFFNLLVFNRIHNAMRLNKMSRTSSRNIGPQHQKYTPVYFIVHLGYFLSFYFLKATSLICEAQLSFAAHQKYILSVFIIVMDD